MNCPQCGKKVTPKTAAKTSDNADFPFCSQRCRLIDLGAWLDGDYAIEAFEPKSYTENGENANIDDNFAD